MTRMSNLPEDLIKEILSRAPLTSLKAVRSTCKHWNALSKTRVFSGKPTATSKQFLGFMLMNSKVCSMSLDLHGVISPCITKVSILTDISQVFHCDGLLLLVTTCYTKIGVWNPYLGQIKWIKSGKIHNCYKYVLGYDNNRNHKIMRLLDNSSLLLELYDFNSSSWRALAVTNSLLIIDYYGNCLSLKGNTYFLGWNENTENILLCFDFTTESLASHMPLPYYDSGDEARWSLSCVREEQLAIIYQSFGNNSMAMDIYVTDKIEPNAVSWRKFLKMEYPPSRDFSRFLHNVSFCIDEEDKVVVVFDVNASKDGYVIGDAGYFKTFEIRQDSMLSTRGRLMFSSYVPSLVQLQINKDRRRKERDF